MAISNTPAQDYVQSDYTSSARFRANGSAQEQKTIENLIVETIEIYGQDIYYVPRTIVNKDTVFGEDSDTKFESAKAIRAYVNNVEGWEGQGELLSKFGVRIEDKTTFIFSREKFKEHVDDSVTLNVEGRPNEGDLIYFPTTYTWLIFVLLTILLINLCCLIECFPNSNISPNTKYFLEFFDSMLLKFSIAVLSDKGFEL